MKSWCVGFSGSLYLFDFVFCCIDGQCSGGSSLDTIYLFEAFAESGRSEQQLAPVTRQHHIKLIKVLHGV